MGFFPICHISSSKQSKNIKRAYDMVRLGIDMYEINDEISMSGEVIEIKEVKKGECIGYNYSFKAKENMTIACINIGYGDIAIRKLSNRGKVIINGVKRAIVGNVCMDCLFVDITNLDVKLGERAYIFGKVNENSISICEVASICDTISYEMFTSISERVKRIYR